MGKYLCQRARHAGMFLAGIQKTFYNDRTPIFAGVMIFLKAFIDTTMKDFTEDLENWPCVAWPNLSIIAL
jgi:hypothetical protein